MSLTTRVRENVAKEVRRHVLPGEELRVAAMGSLKNRKRWLLALIATPLVAFAERPCYLAVTDRRFLVLQPGLMSRTASLEVERQLGQVAVVGERLGRVRSSLTIRLLGETADRTYEFGPGWRDQVGELAELLLGQEPR